MSYTEDQIKHYLNILHIYNKPKEEISNKSKCCNCQNTYRFDIVSGYKVCDECGTTNGHVLGLYDVKDYERTYYKKKSIYQRKYHYEKKVNQISKRINLNDEEKCILYEKLLEIDNYIMKILNKEYFRKRLININYLSKKLLEEMGFEKYKLIVLKISSQTLEIYEKWWDSYKELKNLK